MLERLPESRARHTRSVTGAVTSIAAHAAIIAGALHATAQSRPRPAEPPKVLVFPVVPKSPPSVSTSVKQPTQSAPGMRPLPFIVVRIEPKIPSLDLVPLSPTDARDFPRGGVSVASSGNSVAAVLDPTTTFRADQVDQQVSVLPGAPSPAYPEALRSAGVEGRVTAQFTVNELGLVESDSVRFIQSDNVLFEQSVRRVLTRMHFAPAEIGGKKVRQLVQMPFVFTLTRR
ncbi:MAG TPA: TonB family protein [Gemmatimonadaceae bacterium]|nr:TonB family protein [Gemmatimonadaceae bacterium]